MALKPITVRPLLESMKLNSKRLLNLLIYYLLFDLRYKPSQSIAIDLLKLKTFKKLYI
jgi:hypothetical protein